MYLLSTGSVFNKLKNNVVILNKWCNKIKWCNKKITSNKVHQLVLHKKFSLQALLPLTNQ